jgi:2-dehydro-3-deoxy-D-arabinonate dehydratase
MRLYRYRSPDRRLSYWVEHAGRWVDLTAVDPERFHRLWNWLLGSEDPIGEVKAMLARQQPGPPPPEGSVLCCPMDSQEVWAAGVTYLRSKEARMEESEGGGSFYDKVYTAARPELFLKATPSRVSPPGDRIRIRSDAAWNVPEPELALFISPRGQILGYTIGNDLSSRDIEGENPLYLPQAKVYRQCCSLGPAILLEEERRDHREFDIRMTIERNGSIVFAGETSTGRMKRRFHELVEYLFRDNVFADGVFLLTGTGIVPPDDFTLQPEDRVAIEVPGIGVLENQVVQG